MAKRNDTATLLHIEELLQSARLTVQAVGRVAELPARGFDGATVEAAGRVITTLCGEAETALTAAIREIDDAPARNNVVVPIKA